MNALQIIKGNIIFTREFGKYEVINNGYIVVKNGKVQGVYSEIPEDIGEYNLEDYGDKLIIPGFCDIHLHGPQFPNLGLGLDKELMPWLETYTFPEERKFNDIEYAREVYSSLIKELLKNGTTSSCIFGTIHGEADGMLLEMLSESGLSGYVGKVNMDRNCPEFLMENTENSLLETEEFLKKYSNRYRRVKPIVTPRFVPTCSFELLKGLGSLAEKYDVPIQSHLSENKSEVDFVKELHPECKNYTDVYYKAGLLRSGKTIMAHCVLLQDEEIEVLSKNNIYIAHCPSSNSNLASGIAPIRKLLGSGIPVGLGSDISAGHSLSMCDVIVNAAQMSNMKWLESGRRDKPLTTSELFYMATKGSGSFFGKVGSFEKDYEFDALVIDDSDICRFKELTTEERLQKFIYTGSSDNIKVRYASGRVIGEDSYGKGCR